MFALDWAILAIYICITLGVGYHFSKKASRNTTNYFLAGRSLSWFLVGTSLVATTFSASTPLMVAGMSRATGIYDNWLWWSTGLGFSAAIFFFARLWRRSEVSTDLEFLVMRYGKSRQTTGLRIFKVFLDGVLINCVILASALLAMTKIMQAFLPFSGEPLFTLPFLGEITPTLLILIFFGCGTVIFYSSASGLYGVVFTDMFQFILAMAGCIILVIFVMQDASKGEGMMSKIQNAPGYHPDIIKFFPDLTSFNLKSLAFGLYFIIALAGAAGHGYLVQRLLATKSEKDSMLGFMWFCFCHLVLRPWPWIIVGVLSLHYLPDLADPESAFAEMSNMFLPVGFKGFMVTAFLAAFMSTISTQVNWGASYLINDFYKPYILRTEDDESSTMLASKLATILLAILSIVIALRLTGILQAYKYVMVIAAGIGPVMIARWYWWRVNAWTEITAVLMAFLSSNILQFALPESGEVDYFAVRASLTIAVTTPSWIIVALLTNCQPDENTKQFYRKTRVGGPGWEKVAQITGVEPVKNEVRNNIIGWLSSSLCLYCSLLGIGKLFFQQYQGAVIYLVLAALGGYMLMKTFKKVNFGLDE
jgi:SSS family solute:Na+ symporter